MWPMAALVATSCVLPLQWFSVPCCTLETEKADWLYREIEKPHHTYYSLCLLLTEPTERSGRNNITTNYCFRS